MSVTNTFQKNLGPYNFSPTSEHILLAYGRRHSSLLRSIVIDGETTVPIYGKNDQTSPVANEVARLFNEAAQISPDDTADVHIVLGVLYNLSREYDKAIGFFQTTLKLKPRDYSLWNKLGTTQANSVQSAEAISAYQQVVIWNNFGLPRDYSLFFLLFLLYICSFSIWNNCIWIF
ncbi:hypothetical protein GIB67_015577 [Kingdonia uniflora]|uniref:Peroxin-5 n=1 Tax=Kingdonia uniflora TaxID=39325 RepID=A0A7J7LU76_9MAGN|nr:hypothetical protein GIB67_015577 [Kingdonia uniflora]